MANINLSIKIKQTNYGKYILPVIVRCKNILGLLTYQEAINLITETYRWKYGNSEWKKFRPYEMDTQIYNCEEPIKPIGNEDYE